MIAALEPVFSPCGRFRYTLTQDLPALTATRGTLVFIGLNPSIAGRIVNGKRKGDPTAGRMAGFGMALCFRRVVTVNLGALISTDPAGLREAPDWIGPDNDEHLLRECLAAELVIAAWGAATKVPRALVQPRANAVRARLERAGVELHALRITAGGAPEHPLYLPGELRPTRWTP